MGRITGHEGRAAWSTEYKWLNSPTVTLIWASKCVSECGKRQYKISLLKIHSLMLAQQPIALQNLTSKLERKLWEAVVMFLLCLKTQEITHVGVKEIYDFYQALPYKQAIQSLCVCVCSCALSQLGLQLQHDGLQLLLLLLALDRQLLHLCS